MDVTETELPGVGKRFEVDVGGETVVVLVHNSGRRELFVRPDADADAEKLLDLGDREARVVGSILEGAYFQPVATDETATVIASSLLVVTAPGTAGPIAAETVRQLNAFAVGYVLVMSVLGTTLMQYSGYIEGWIVTRGSGSHGLE